ncbi:hypothetical protein DBP21_08795 [Streptomyces sp. CS147]|nr:hypothetical protein DBP21_08795 [Streptomyces sp. CS147]
MPNSQDPARKAIDAAFGPPPRKTATMVRCPSRCDGCGKGRRPHPRRDTADGPQAAQVREENPSDLRRS